MSSHLYKERKGGPATILLSCCRLKAETDSIFNMDCQVKESGEFPI